MKAILRDGHILPQEPVPMEWEEGAVLEVAKIDSVPFDINVWAQTMAQLCADSTVEEEEMMRQEIAEHRQQAKAQMRREMGLPS